MEVCLHVLVAHEPRAYRQALATVLPDLRPRLRVHLVEPANLDAAAAELRPLLVVCGRLTPAVRAHAASWVVLYPGGADWADIGGVLGERRIERPALDDLLAVIDALVAQAASPGGGTEAPD